MAFVDELNIHIKAGRGGDGVVRWLHEKGKEFSGPAGGNGGGGGSVFIVGVSDIGLLATYKGRKKFEAANGGSGESGSRHGANGDGLDLALPVGSIITNLFTEQKYQLRAVGERFEILKGGRGGLGNEHFKGSKNVTPEESTPGKEGEEADFYIELELVADVGIVGLPNAGKSSLLNAITNAEAKVGAYQFTTLEPNLGALYEVILADIPGLIEGAAEGKGLGTKFLRHIKRTAILLHCISLENEDPMAVYEVIRGELAKYGQNLVDKEEIVLLTKTDVVTGADKAEIEAKIAAVAKPFEKMGKQVLTVSAYDDEALKAFKDEIVKIVRTRKEEEKARVDAELLAKEDAY